MFVCYCFVQYWICLTTPINTMPNMYLASIAGTAQLVRKTARAPSGRMRSIVQ